MEKSLFILNPSNDVLVMAANLRPDSIFVNHESISSAFPLTSVKSKLPEVKVYDCITVFGMGDLNQRHPVSPGDSGKIVTYDGSSVEESQGSYFCPTDPQVRNAALAKVEVALSKDIDGIWFDGFYYGTLWKTSDPVLLDSCYCSRCLELFESYIGEKLSTTTLEDIQLLIDGSYYHEWLEFKAGNLVSLAQETRSMITASGKDKQLGFFVVPWKETDYGAGIKRLLGQDFSKLMNVFDVFSPLLYHKMLGKDVSFIKEMVEYYWQVGKSFLPLIQTENTPTALSPSELETALTSAVVSPSAGVCVFNLDDLLQNQEKLAVVQRFFST